MKAEWIVYTNNNGESYKRPCCPKCSEEYEPTPVVYKNGKYICLNCQQVIELTYLQKRWIDRMRRTRKKVDKCFMCGAYRMVLTQRRDPVTHKWKTCSGKCGNCDCKLIV